MPEIMISLYSVSIIMATYNGEEYIEQQLDSILEQLLEGDELIISDDGSDDRTRVILERYKVGNYNANIRIVDGPESGVAANFANAMKYVTNEIVFFSDQDDIWLPKKREVVVETFEQNPDCILVTHDAYLLSESEGRKDKTIFQLRNAGNGLVRNLMRSTYYGCCMAVRKSFLDELVPYVADTVAHDQYISLVAEKRMGSFLVEKPLIIHRIHANNQSKRMSFAEMIRFRTSLAISVRNFK